MYVYGEAPVGVAVALPSFPTQVASVLLIATESEFTFIVLTAVLEQPLAFVPVTV